MKAVKQTSTADSGRPILLTGVTGQVGHELLPLLAPFGKVVAPARNELDLTNIDAMREFVHEVRPRWIVNTAAYTAVDKAESEPELARLLNTEASRVLGEAAAHLGAPVIHFSTDYVFDGSGTKPWVETEPTGPLNVYGATKLAGEQALASTGAPYFIFRTSWVYGSYGTNFLRAILRLACEREELRIVADQHGAPTWSRDLARLVIHVMHRIESAAATQGVTLREAAAPLSGIYHAAGSGEASWFGFAHEFLRLAGEARPHQHLAKLVPISTAEYPTPARRPLNSRLDCTRLQRVFGFTMPRWQESTAEVLREVLAAE